MRASLIQRQLELNAQVLTGLHSEHKVLKSERKKFNERADDCFRQMMIADDQLDFDASHQHKSEGEANREQAEVFTPYIKKFAKKIAGLQEVQKALKHELGCAQCMEAWQADESYEWNFDAAKFNMPLYEIHGHVGPDGFVVWDE